jgi:glycosyltransferase involved in cell wall biosynthesis
MEQHVLDLVEGMVNRGHKVYVWCKPGEITSWYKEAGAEAYERYISFDIDPKYILKLRKFLRENEVEVLHSHELKAAANSLIAGFLAGTKVRISHIHTPLSEWEHPNLAKKIVGRMQILGYAIEVNLFSHKEIVLTKSRKKAKKKEGIFESKMEVIPNGLDLGRFDTPPETAVEFKNEIRDRYSISGNTFVFGYVSRMTAEKGHKDLVEAFYVFLNNQLPKSRTKEDYHLFLAGGGQLEQEVKDLIQQKNLSKLVTVTGIFPPEDLPKFYRTFDAFVFPTLAEGFGYVLIEAMYTGVPTICSDLEVLREVAGDTVEYFSPGNVHEMAQKMRQLYEKIVSGQAGTKGMVQRVINRYSMSKFIANYQNLYTNLLSKKK